MVAAGALATLPVWRNLVETAWRHGEIGHLLLALLVAAFLAWVRRERIRVCEPRGTWVGPLLVVAGWLLGWLGEAAGLLIAQHLAGMVILLGCFLAVTGMDILRQFLPAIAALLFMIPLPWTFHEQVAQPFAQGVADISFTLFTAAGLHTDHATVGLAVSGQAAGGGGFKAILLVAYGLAFGQPLRLWVRLLILAATPTAVVVCQVVGALVVVGLLRLEGLDPAWLAALAGWALLPLVIVALVGLVRLLRWATVPVRYYSLAHDA